MIAASVFSFVPSFPICVQSQCLKIYEFAIRENTTIYKHLSGASSIRIHISYSGRPRTGNDQYSVVRLGGRLPVNSKSAHYVTPR